MTATTRISGSRRRAGWAATLRAGVVALAAGVAGVGAAGLVSAIHRPEAPPERHRVDTLAVAELSDDRQMVGLAEDVFLGSVVGELGTTRIDGVPETQFEVTVQHPIKGALTGTVTVSQAGGVDEEGDEYVVDEDDPLQAGRTYLFASRTNPDTGWHTLIPRYGTLAADTATDRLGLLARFERAEATQLAYDPTA